MATQDEKISQLANLLPLTGGERIIADQDGETRGGRIDSILALVSALISTVITDQGNYDASTNVFPSTGGTGSAGSIKLGNQFTISVNGTLGGEVVFAPYDTIRAIRDNPGQDPTAWYIQHNNIATTPPTNQLSGTPGRISISIISGIATINIDPNYKPGLPTSQIAVGDGSNKMNGSSLLTWNSSSKYISLDAALLLGKITGSDYGLQTLSGVNLVLFGPGSANVEVKSTAVEIHDNGTTLVDSLAGTGNRVVVADANGVLSAVEQVTYEWITDITIKGYLEDTSNWSLTVYGGPTITGTFQSQKHYNATYKFEAIDNNIWKRTQWQ